MIWYDVIARLKESGLEPVEETYMENYGKILTAQRPEFRDRGFRCAYGVVKSEGVDVEFFLFPDQLQRDEFMEVVGSDPWWIAKDNVVLHFPECDLAALTRVVEAISQ